MNLHTIDAIIAKLKVDIAKFGHDYDIKALEFYKATRSKLLSVINASLKEQLQAL